MNSLDDLASLDLRLLSEVLAAHALTVHELGSGQWLGVVELITMRLMEASVSLSVESWATCSLAHAYALEAAVASGAIDERESVIRRLNLSVTLLRRIPPNVAVDILNPSHLIDILFQELPISAEEARELSVDWRALDIAQIRLRAVKKLVSPVLSLARLVSEKDVNGREFESVGRSISLTSMSS